MNIVLESSSFPQTRGMGKKETKKQGDAVRQQPASPISYFIEHRAPEKKIATHAEKGNALFVISDGRRLTPSRAPSGFADCCSRALCANTVALKEH